VPIGKLERIVVDIRRLLVDLPENRCVVSNRLSSPAQKYTMDHGKAFLKSDFRAGKEANRHTGRFEVRESASPGAKISRNESVAHCSRSRAYVLQTIVTHFGILSGRRRHRNALTPAVVPMG
jgi:hypothetical protein